MARTRRLLECRAMTCLKKYRVFFIFVGILMCIQIYLAYSFFIFEKNQGQKKSLVKKTDEAIHRYYYEDKNRETKWIKHEDFFQSHNSKKVEKVPSDKVDLIKTNNNNNKIMYNVSKTKYDKNMLGFTPVCEMTGKESISAVTRARSRECKELIVNVSCSNQQGQLYPDRLYSLCSHSTGFIGRPKNIGCYKDDKNQRILSDYYTIIKANNSPEECAFLCLQSGYPFAGTEYSVECFCGFEIPSSAKRIPNSSCNMKCPGDSLQHCGGYLAINVYQTGIKRFKAQEARNSSTKIIDKNNKESPARIAFLLTVNGRASRQVKRLINVLYDPLNFYYIHVDARQDYMYREMLRVEKACKKKNIKVAKGVGLRHASIWGGASLLTTFLTSAQQMLQYSQHWDFLVNLSESDYPIKNNTQLIDFLTWNKGFNFVKSHGREVQRFISKQGLDKTFVECETRMWRLSENGIDIDGNSNINKKRKLPKGIQVDGGSDWVALSRNFVEYVANPKPDELVSELLKIFKYTLLPAESFFHTVLRNSKFCDTYVDNNLHVTNWKRKLGCKCQYKAIVDWCGCSPNVFKLDDFNRIRNTEDKNLFFARKFESVIDIEIINKVEEWIFPENKKRKKYYLQNKMNINDGNVGKSRRDKNDKNNSHNSSRIDDSNVNNNNNNMYWQNLFHHGDLSPPRDDVIHSISESLARLVYFKLYSINASSTNIIAQKYVRLLETTAYFRKNQHKGILILVEIDNHFENLESNLNLPYFLINTTSYHDKDDNNNNKYVERFEAFITMKRDIFINKKWRERITFVAVNTDYDQKEQIFRNFLGGIGPLSSPVFAYEFDTSLLSIVTLPKNLTILWIQPNGNLVDINHVQLLNEETSLTGSIKLRSDEPLSLGKWHVLLLTNNNNEEIDDRTLIVQLTFFVTPTLKYWKNREINMRNTEDINIYGFNYKSIKRQRQRYLQHEFSNVKWFDIIKKAGIFQQDNEQKKYGTNFKNKTSNSELMLNIWTDEIVREQYIIQKICSVVNQNKFVTSRNIESLSTCAQTDWSSLSPDPKSDIYNLCEK